MISTLKHFSLVINVKDKEHIGASFIASVTIPSEDLLTEETIDGKLSYGFLFVSRFIK